MRPRPKIYTVSTESIQTPLKCSLFVSLQPFAKIQKVNFISHLDRKQKTFAIFSNSLHFFAILLKKKN